MSNYASSGWQHWSGSSQATLYPTTITTSGTSILPFRVMPQQLPGVLESPAAELTDREWLDAQVGEVCALAVI